MANLARSQLERASHIQSLRMRESEASQRWDNRCKLEALAALIYLDSRKLPEKTVLHHLA